MSKKTCEWIYSEDWKMWETECDEPFELSPNMSPALSENKMIFCPFCGKKIKEVKE